MREILKAQTRGKKFRAQQLQYIDFATYSTPWTPALYSHRWHDTYILLTKHEGRTGRILARGLESTDRA